MLVDVALEEETGESVRLSSLQALTNLSVMEHHHNHYTRIIQKLYDFLDGQNSGIRLQAAKILVNLSCNPELVPHMLAAKVRSSVIHKILLSISCNAEIVRHILVLAVEEFLSKSKSLCLIESDAHFYLCITFKIIMDIWQSLVFSHFQMKVSDP